MEEPSSISSKNESMEELSTMPNNNQKSVGERSQVPVHEEKVQGNSEK
jgi:hypothetical protein